MSRAAVELDFFPVQKDTSSAGAPSRKLFDRRRSFRDIQSVISKIDPEVLKNVFASGSVDKSLIGKSSASVPSTPKGYQNALPPLPVYTPTFRPTSSSEGSNETSPLTIFYKGTVTVFDVSPHTGENILKLANEGGSKAVQPADAKPGELMETFNGDLPLFRRKSLQRFLQKRKERLTSVSPYGFSTDSASSGQNTPAL
ncbi:hypothetical protein RJ639_003825 [Escallonia herrerae]|uniref:Protein TIFY n=1 Tax=Escallonia herrerae TaxID=1293975 RepID=A0AA88W7M9_9ASTE|nr:hypothetical protein RJ639_003825 [Escallonia herrerae]